MVKADLRTIKASGIGLPQKQFVYSVIRAHTDSIACSVLRYGYSLLPPMRTAHSHILLSNKTHSHFLLHINVSLIDKR